jgi:hypothetical protein
MNLKLTGIGGAVIMGLCPMAFAGPWADLEPTLNELKQNHSKKSEFIVESSYSSFEKDPLGSHPVYQTIDKFKKKSKLLFRNPQKSVGVCYLILRHLKTRVPSKILMQINESLKVGEAMTFEKDEMKLGPFALNESVRELKIEQHPDLYNLRTSKPFRKGSLSISLPCEESSPLQLGLLP